jgi:DUF1680 family protein
LRQSRLQPKKYDPLPLGSVKPLGWLKRQLEIQAAGLGGHVDEVWPDLSADNKWFGGNRDGWERGPYFADGLIPLAWLLDDEELKAKATKWVDAFLSSQNEEGWIGPVSYEDPRYGEYDPWPIFVVFKALVQYQEATNDERIIPAMLRFCEYLRNHTEDRPLKSWGKFRWQDLIISLFWLYERTNEEWLLDLAAELQAQGYDWREHFARFIYKREADVKLETHVVNNAMALKAPAVWYRYSGNPADLEGSAQGMAALDKFHGQVTGMFSGDEHFAGKHPSRGTELCAVVEYMFSLEQLLAVTGEPYWGDRLEKITFNALPATFTPDMWAHQYDQQVNQVLCTVAERPWTNGPDANIFGLEPNFGCCTANMHQGWPKFAANLWMSVPSGGLAAVAYAPCEVQTNINGQSVTVREETDYPFRDTIKIHINTSAPVEFPVYLRIPEWAEHAVVKLPNGSTIQGEPGKFLEVCQTWSNGDVIVLTLPMEIKTERRYRGAVAITRGPLVYSLKIGEEWKRIGGQLPAADWEIYPTTPWNYGLIIPEQFPQDGVKVVEKPLGDCPFSPDQAPIELEVEGRLVPEWQLEDEWAGAIPASPIRSQQPREKLTLIPYGCTNLRITEFPLIDED